VLPPGNRLRRSADFGSAVRVGVRARSGRVVVHQQPGAGNTDVSGADAPARVGLIVGKGIGGSVVRHRVSRRLRAQLALRLDALPRSSVTVVRALPGSAGASSASLGRDLDRALATLVARR
jgi:ribonuclease P protein component